MANKIQLSSIKTNVGGLASVKDVDNHLRKTLTQLIAEINDVFSDNVHELAEVKKVYANRKKGGGVEREIAYAGEINYFKQGAYNQANAKSTKSETYGGDIAKQYANGSYAEVWFKEATVGEGTNPNE